MRLRQHPRCATTIVESAVIYPVAFFLLLALVVGAMGAFRFQETASLARETARYASVHGTQYAKENGVTAPTPDQIKTAAFWPQVVNLDPSQLTCDITYDTANGPYHTTIDANGNVIPITNKVIVTVTYRWLPEAILGGITMSSTSVMPMSY